MLERKIAFHADMNSILHAQIIRDGDNHWKDDGSFHYKCLESLTSSNPKKYMYFSSFKQYTHKKWLRFLFQYILNSYPQLFYALNFD